MQPQGGWKFFRLIKIEGFNHIPDVPPQLFPRVTFGHDCLGQTLSAIAAVGFLDHFEDEFSHTREFKRPVRKRQVPAWRPQKANKPDNVSWRQAQSRRSIDIAFVGGRVPL